MEHKTDETPGKYDIQEDVQEAMEMLGQGYEKVRIRDESNDRKYFVITPRIIKAYSRNPYDLALWDTVKDIAGESGECYLNTEQLAIMSGMSTGQASKSRRWWLKLGFLKGEMKRDPGYVQKVWHLTVPDIWRQNVEWCEKHPKIEDRLAFKKAHRSLHLVKPSHSEGKPSPGETKKIESKKIQQERERFNPLFSTYETNIGPITSKIADEIEAAEKKYGAEWVNDAIILGGKNSARHWHYCESILENWKRNGRQEKTGSKERAAVNPEKYTQGEYSDYLA